MAKIWYAREGDRHTAGQFQRELSLQEFEKLFKVKVYNLKFRGVKPEIPSDNPKFDHYRERKYFMLQVTTDDVASYNPHRMGFHPDLKEGFYEGNVSAQECESILRSHQV